MSKFIYDEKLSFPEENGVKRLFKRLIRKSVSFLLIPYIQFQNQVNEQLKENIEETERLGKEAQRLKQETERLKQETELLKEETVSLRREAESSQEELECQKEQLQGYVNALEKKNVLFEDNMGAMAREIMLAKWKIIDHLEDSRESGHDMLECIICSYHAERRTFRTLETDCIFNGGHLIRYVCPDCGAVFGPTKFLERAQQQIDDDYHVHYLGFSEGDSSYKEERAFYMLKPDKDKVYLNYGCGHWSKTLQNLREQGYEVYGYEPYSPDENNPYMITSKEELKKMKFDGIFSNDLLEHLLDPVSDLREMSELLIDRDSKMSHCTSCYTYKYEYTRFHTCFFLGDSVKRMCDKAGLEIIDKCDDIEKNDFYCYVFKPKALDINYIDKMFYNDYAEKKQETIMIHKGGIVFGPYITLLPRKYHVHFTVEGEKTEGFITVYNQKGKNIFAKKELRLGKNEIEFVLEKKEPEIEFVIQNIHSDILLLDLSLV